jgi:hypothetical protein
MFHPSLVAIPSARSVFLPRHRSLDERCIIYAFMIMWKPDIYVQYTQSGVMTVSWKGCNIRRISHVKLQYEILLDL